jgi:uncharacterized protein
MEDGRVVPRWRDLFACISGIALSNAAFAVAVVALNTPVAASVAPRWEASAFLAIALPGHFIFFSALLGLLPIMLSLARRCPWLALSGAVLVYTLAACVLLVDAKVYQLYRFHINAMVMNMVFGGALGDQVDLTGADMLFAAGVALAVLVAEILLAMGWWRLVRRRPRWRRVVWLWPTSLVIMLAGQAVAAYAIATVNRPVIASLSRIPWGNPLSARRLLATFGVAAAGTKTEPSSDDLLDYPRVPLACTNPAGLNLLVVAIESLRWDAMTSVTMPDTWELAQRSAWFRRHYSTGSATRFGMFGLMYGLPGGYWQAMLSSARAPVLVQGLQEAGYAMHIYGSAPLTNPEFDRTIFSSAREYIKVAPAELGKGERDENVARQLVADMHAADTSKPFFGFIFFDGTHVGYAVDEGEGSSPLPVAPPPDYRARSNQTDPAPYRNRYLSAVRRMDRRVGELIRGLESSQLAGNTVVVITGDHGEEFNDNGANFWGHNSAFTDEQTRVPMIVYWPGRAAATIDGWTTHEDLVPTLMSRLLGCTNPVTDYSTGRDLFGPAQADRVLLFENWSNRAIRKGSVIYELDSYGSISVHDRHYRELPDTTIDSSAMAQAWEKLTRFRAGAKEASAARSPR